MDFIISQVVHVSTEKKMRKYVKAFSNKDRFTVIVRSARRNAVRPK